jgi:hypothetical protein
MISVLLISCGEDELIDTSVRVKMNYNGTPLVMFEEMQYPDGRTMFFTRISFYIENLQISSSSGNKYSLLDREYIDLTVDHGTSSSALKGSEIGSIELPSDTYSVNFDIGVNPIDNAKTPVDFTSDNVLSRTSEYWSGWTSYIFARVEGKIDLNGDGVLEEGFSLHMGGDDAFRSIECSNKTVDGENNEIVIEMELKNLFGSDINIYDIDSNPQIHRPDQNKYVIELVDNLVTCFQ